MKALIVPFILLAGSMQSMGNAMNAQLKTSLANPWIASAVSFTLVLAVFVCAAFVSPQPFPTKDGIAGMPWWAPLGGLVGAVAVFAGLTLTPTVGAGPFIGLTVTASLITSLAIDNFGWFGMPVHAINAWRIAGGALMALGITLIARF